MEILKVPATIEKVETLKDGGLKLAVETQELGPEDKSLVMQMHNKLGWFLFSEQPPTVDDCKDLPTIVLEDGEKQPSQRLRGVLFVYWEQKKITEPFDVFYRKKVEEFINVIKEKLT